MASNLYPTDIVSGLTIDPSSSPKVTFATGWKFDFDKGEFVTTPTGRFAPATGKEAYLEWAQKALLTPRYRHPIYSRNYGHEFDDLMGRGYTHEVAESEIRRIVNDTLMVDPRTNAVQNFAFTWDSDSLHFTCEILMANSEKVILRSKAVIS